MILNWRWIWAILVCCVAVPVWAIDLSLPVTARETASRDGALDQVAVPVGIYRDGTLPTMVIEGPVTRRTYRIPSSGLTPLQILVPLRAQLEMAGYEVLLDCDQDSCGGFDFRFAIDVLPAPNMYVNIRAYHFLSAHLPDIGAAVTVLASAAAGAGYLQVVQINVPMSDSPTPVPDPAPPDGAEVESPEVLTEQLVATGRVVLRDLEFGLGDTALARQATPDLEAIAQLLQFRPNLRIAVVGHTDTVGGLEANIAVSRARARSVRTALITTYGAPGDRIEAEGMGYLSPTTSNLTAQGREANRRVEVIVLSDTP